MILDRFAMTDKVAIVTGAGRGIGAATAVSLAEAGADVVISARTADQLDQVGRQIEAVGRRAVVVPADLSDLEAVAALVEQARDAFGRLNLVVNNVGGAMPRPFMDTSPGRLEQAFQFNVATAHALLRPAVPLMLEGGGGSAVNISSAMGRLSGRGYLAYGTAKGALAHYTRLAAADLSPQIRVNAIAVGSVATSALDIVMQTDELRMALEAGTPLKRIGDPNDIAAAVVYLASDAGSYITGKILEVDGGIESPNLDMGLPDL
ncbi:MAG: SDR family oxidoreductase [Acidimicrobiales bacterium]|nr:SDR family oxidoreductase [Acidimicrobiales bacterium]